MTGKFLTIVAASALVAGSGGIAIAAPANTQAGTDWGDQGMHASHALNMLEDQGDGQFTNFAASGANFTADVTKDGKTFRMLIDPSTEQIQQQT